MQTEKQNQTEPLPPGIVQVNGFVFDVRSVPARLLAKLQRVSVQLRTLGLEKTGVHERNGKTLYNFFEEAELVKHLVALLASEKIGYAAGTSRITGRYEAYKTNSGNIMWSHYVSAGVLFTDADTNEWVIVPGVGEASDSGDKGVTKAITSAIKYILMKTFMVSEGNDIEVPREDEKKPDVKTEAPAPKKSTVQNKCADCKGVIMAIEGTSGVNIPAEVVAAKSKEKFGKMLCGGCAKKRSTANAERPAAQTQATQTEEDDGRRIETLEGNLAKHPQKRVVDIKRGKNPGKKNVYDLELPGGVRITDWHESHFEHYEEARKGDHVKLVVEVKKEGKYTNRNVNALMEICDLCLEDGNGKEVFESPGQSEAADQHAAARQQDAESNAFDASDEDIPF